MRQSSANDLFLNSSFSTIEAHQYQPFRQGCIDVKMPAPNTDIRLFIFKPVDYPYLWVKYLKGLEREYARMSVGHILDMTTLDDPGSADMAMLAIIEGEIVAGLRLHTGLKKAENASVYKEMAGGDLDLLKKHLDNWIPDGIVEPKGLWLNTKLPARKRLLNLMARSGIYGTALLDCRYSICTSPQNITRMHVGIGMQVMEEIGCVAYPTEDHQTTFGCFDLYQILDRCDDQNRILFRRDWQQIQLARLNSSEQTKEQNLWLPLILDEANPFHAQALESLLLDGTIAQRSHYQSMKKELAELIPPVDSELSEESKRWVTYPWKKVAIEMLGPKSFKKLRTDRNRNKITDAEQAQLAQLKVGVVGLSTGHVIAHTLIMEGVCGSLKLADFDVLEASNLNRIPASLVDIGVNKAVITARRIAELDPYVFVDVYEEGLNESNIDDFMKDLDIVIEECDSLDVKVLVREAAIQYKIPVLMATSDMGMMDVERFDIDANAKPFHGLADISASKLKDLSRRDKSGYALAIVGGERISARLAASMVEIDHTVTTWAQLASDVTQGAAMAVTAVRRIGTGQNIPSSRIKMDIDRCFDEGTAPEVPSDLAKQATVAPEFSGNVREDMLLAAQYAPSPGNIQPWSIYWKEDALHLEVNRDLTSSADIKGRGAMASIGAACFNAEVVAAYHHQAISVESFPSAHNADLVARIRFNNDAAVNTSLQEFYPHLLSRVTNRELSARQKIPLDVMKKLGSATANYPVNLHSLSSQESLNQFAEVISGADRVRHLCRHLHQEMMSELVWPGVDSLENGIDVRTLGLPEKELNVLPILARRDVMDELAAWNGGKALGDYNKERITNASAMTVITANGQTDTDYFIAGKALQQFWLTADQQGLVAQPVSPIFLYANSADEMNELMQGEYLAEVSSLRDDFCALFNIKENEYPVLAIRMAYAPQPSFRSLRRKS